MNVFYYIRDKIRSVYTRWVNSISFYPAIISLAFALFAMILVYTPYIGFIEDILDLIPYLNITDMETARAILTTLIGGIISLLVLSFSLVMVVLSQALSNYSPKILIGLVSNKSHQIVLGVYLGTITYSLILLLSFRADANFSVKSLGVIINIIMAIACLFLFVYFIHNISRNIQANVIIRNIYKATLKELREEIEKIEDTNMRASWDDTTDGSPYILKAWKSGYLQKWDNKKLSEKLVEKGWLVHIDSQKGDYITKGSDLIQIWGLHEDEQEGIEKIFKPLLYFYDGEDIGVNYTYGFTQLMEIAIKALSPSLNDPGTARLCIHYLTDMFRILMRVPPYRFYADSEGHIRISWNLFTMESLMYKVWAPIRYYGREDDSIQLGILKALHSLSTQDDDKRFQKLLNLHFRDTVANLKEMSDTELSRSFIENRIPKSSYFEYEK